MNCIKISDSYYNKCYLWQMKILWCTWGWQVCVLRWIMCWILDEWLSTQVSMFSIFSDSSDSSHFPHSSCRAPCHCTQLRLVHSPTLQLTNKIKEGICKKHLFIILFYTYFDTNNWSHGLDCGTSKFEDAIFWDQRICRESRSVKSFPSSTNVI